MILQGQNTHQSPQSMKYGLCENGFAIILEEFIAIYLFIHLKIKLWNFLHYFPNFFYKIGNIIFLALITSLSVTSSCKLNLSRTHSLFYAIHFSIIVQICLPLNANWFSKSASNSHARSRQNSSKVFLSS